MTKILSEDILEGFRKQIVDSINSSPLVIEQFVLLVTSNDNTGYKPLFDECGILLDNADIKLLPKPQQFVLELDSTEHNIRLFDNHQVHIAEYNSSHSHLLNDYRNRFDTKQLAYLAELGDTFSDWTKTN